MTNSSRIRHLSRRLFFSLIILGVSLETARASTTATVAVVAPDFELPTGQGKSFRLSKHNGHVRILFFIRNEGHFVPRALEMIEKIVASSPVYRKNSLLVCILAAGVKGPQLNTLRKRFHLKWIFLLDRTRQVHRLYGVIAVPTVVVVDKKGIVSARLAGYSLSFGKEFRVALRRSLGLGPVVGANSNATTASRHAARFVSLGDLMVRLGNSQAALRNFQKALELAPEMRAARWRAGFCLLRAGKVKPAKEEFQLLLDEGAPSTHALVGLTWAKALEGKTEQAEAELEKLRPQAYNLPEYFEAWAAVHEAMNAKAAARRDLQQADRLRGRRTLRPVRTPGKEKKGKK